MMKKWAQQIEAQRRRYRERTRNSDGSRAGGTSQTEFEFMRNQPNLENPYARPGEDDEEDDSETLVGSSAPSWVGPGQPYSNGYSDFSQSRNASSTSLRSRSTTSESTGPPPSAAAQSRAQPPRMPSGSFTNQPQLSLRTRNLQALASPAGGFVGDSYFSPTPESPMTASSRTSSSSNMYPFPRQQLPQNGYYEEGHGGTRFTAPAMGRPQPSQRDTTSSMSSGYPTAPAQRPGPRAGGAAGMHSAQQIPMAPRNRSASSPDIHNAQRAAANGQQPPVPVVPANYQGFTHMVPRSQNNSPNGGPSRSPPGSNDPRGGYNGPSPTSQLPYDSVARPDLRGGQYPSSRTVTPVPRTNGTPGPPSNGTPLSPDIQPPTQLKVKVHAPSAAQVLTLVVPLHISYQTLKDRIDAKLQRSTNLTLGTVNGGTGVAPSKDNVVKLKYLDEDDYVTIQTDEDVLEAFETWREQRGGDLGGDGMGGMGEIELFCQR